MTSQPVIKLDESIPDHPRLVVELPAEQRTAIQAALDALTEAGDGAMIQHIVMEAFLTAVQQQQPNKRWSVQPET
jgi:hypothetical protein